MRYLVRSIVAGLVAGVLLAGNGCGDDPSSSQNRSPVITSLTAVPGIVDPSGSSTITCAATDPDGDSLSYSWHGGGGTITGSGATVIWNAPTTAGSHAVSVTIDDGRGASTADTTAVEVRGGSFLVQTRSDLYAVDMSGNFFEFYSGDVEPEVLGTRIFVGPGSVRELDQSGNVIGQIPMPDRVTRLTSFSVLPGERVVYMENTTDSLFVAGFDGTLIDAVEMPDASLISQGMNGVVVGGCLIISETGTGKLVELDLTTYEATVFKELDELSGWLNDIDYDSGIFYLAQWEGIHMFTEEGDPTEFFHHEGGRILSVAVVGSFAYATSRTEGRIYKVEIATGESEVFVEGIGEPLEIEFIPVALVAP